MLTTSRRSGSPWRRVNVRRSEVAFELFRSGWQAGTGHRLLPGHRLCNRPGPCRSRRRNRSERPRPRQARRRGSQTGGPGTEGFSHALRRDECRCCDGRCLGDRKDGGEDRHTRQQRRHAVPFAARESSGTNQPSTRDSSPSTMSCCNRITRPARPRRAVRWANCYATICRLTFRKPRSPSQSVGGVVTPRRLCVVRKTISALSDAAGPVDDWTAAHVRRGIMAAESDRRWNRYSNSAR
jgi:hypothetical protein